MVKRVVVEDEITPQRGPRGKPLSDAEKARIVELREEGLSILAISNATGRSTAAVWKALSAVRPD
jgi:hypothetical protein